MSSSLSLACMFPSPYCFCTSSLLPLTFRKKSPIFFLQSYYLFYKVILILYSHTTYFLNLTTLVVAHPLLTIIYSIQVFLERFLSIHFWFIAQFFSLASKADGSSTFHIPQFCIFFLKKIQNWYQTVNYLHWVPLSATEDQCHLFLFEVEEAP